MMNFQQVFLPKEIMSGADPGILEGGLGPPKRPTAECIVTVFLLTVPCLLPWRLQLIAGLP